MAINVVRPNHRPAGPVRSIHYSFARDVHPLAINPHTIMSVLGFPVGVVNTLSITAIATWSLATMQAFIPSIQLGVLTIVGAGVTYCRYRYNGAQSNEHRVPPRVIVHLTPNPDRPLEDKCIALLVN
jgi:hypothetical protein